MANIGIKLATGEFYPILEEGVASGKKLVVTTVGNGQTSVHIDLFKAEDGDLKDAAYIGSLVIDDIAAGKKGEPDIELSLSLDDADVLTAKAVDRASGEGSSLSVEISRLKAEPRLDEPDYSFDEFTDTVELELPEKPEADRGAVEEFPADIPSISLSDDGDLSLPDFDMDSPSEPDSDLEALPEGDLEPENDEFSIPDEADEADEPTLSDDFSIQDTDSVLSIQDDTDVFTVTDDAEEFSLGGEAPSLIEDDFSIPDMDDDTGASPEEFSMEEEPPEEKSQLAIAEEMELPAMDDFSMDEDLDPSLLAQSEQIRKADSEIDFELPEDTGEETTGQTAANEPDLDLDIDILEHGVTQATPKNEYKPFKTEKATGKGNSPLILILCIVAGIVLVLVCGLLIFQCTRSSTAPTVTEQPKTAETTPAPVKPAEIAPAPMAPVEVKPEPVKPAEVKPEPPKAAPPKPVVAKKPGVWYKIKWGDTLWDLANAYYRNPWLWKKIWKANKIKNPNLIISGRWLWVPKK